MNYLHIGAALSLCLMSILPEWGNCTDNAGTNPAHATGTAALQMIKPIYNAEFKPHPHDSVLEDNGYHYYYQGKKIPLLRMKDRIAITSRENSPISASSLKKKAHFKNAQLRQIWRGEKRQIAIMSFDQSSMIEVAKKGYNAVAASLRNDLKKDASIATSSAVYYYPGSGSEVIITDRISVKFSDSTDEALRQRVAELLDATLEKRAMPSVYVFRCNDSDKGDALLRCRALEHVTGVEWAEPEMLYQIKKHFIPDDPLFSRQWHLNNSGQNSADSGAHMDVAAAWDIQKMGDSSISIAIIDDGVDTSHKDLIIKSGGYDFFDGDSDPNPSDNEDMHGTAVAGVAAAVGNNSIGVAGVAAGSSILPIKISKGPDFVSSDSIASAITWAYEKGADVLNNSWGWNGFPNNAIATAIRNASTLGRGGKGCPVFCASGNAASQFSTIQIPFSSDTRCYIAFVYDKNGSQIAGSDRIAIDNLVLYGSDGFSVIMKETFAGSTFPPAGWATSGGNRGSSAPVSGISGWTRLSSYYAGGFGDQASAVSGSIGNNQWSEIRMPLMTFQMGQQIWIQAAVSTEINDYLKLRIYDEYGNLFSEQNISSGITATESKIIYPAGFDSAIAVGSSTDQDFRSDYSQYDVSGTGKTVDFLAPSGGGWNSIPTTDRTGSYGYSSTDYFTHFDGTSSACPAAAGMAALILSRNPNLSRNKVLEVMRKSCDKIGGVAYTDGKNNEYGYGRLNARAALANLPPVIIGQDSIGTTRTASISITTDMLDIFDTETPDGPFSLSVYGSGSTYTVSGSTITPKISSGTLTIPVSVSDGTFSSDTFMLSVKVRFSNSAPVINSQSALSIPEDGKLKISKSNFTIVDADDPYSSLSISIGSGTNYTISGDTIIPVANYYGTLSVPVTVSDGYTASAPFNASITVTPVNDAPRFTPGGIVTVNEDAGAQSITSWATGISAGPNETDPALTFVLSTSQMSLFSALAITAGGDLLFTPTPNISGTATINVRLRDSGGTAYGGIDSSTASTLTIRILSVNDAPTFTPGPAVSINEDAAAQTFTNWATITAGAPDETAQITSISIRVSNESFFTVRPAISANGTLTFTPAANSFGTVQVIATISDNGGTANGGVNSFEAPPFTITILPINDAPVVTAGPDINVNEDAGEQSVANWAPLVSAGANENDQTLSFSVSTSNDALFSSLPSLDKWGTLKFNPAPDAFGSAKVSILVRDNGGTDRYGIDSCVITNINLTISPVNDLPRIAVSGKYDILLGSEAVTIITATDADATIPEISVENLPSFATFSSTSGSAVATITFSPETDTGTFSFKLTAKDNIGSTDTTIFIRVYTSLYGAIDIIGAPDGAQVALNATAGWIGMPARNGAGKIDSVPAGPTLISVSCRDYRTEYYFCTVNPNATSTVTVSLRKHITLGFSGGDSLRTQTTAITAGSLVSTVIDDINNDGQNDVVFTGSDGIIRYCQRNSGSYEEPVTLHTVSSGRNTLRCIDWNNDGINDILTANVDGKIRISLGNRNNTFSPDSTIITINAGCTGIELLPFGTNAEKSFYAGYSDGTVLFASPTADKTYSTSPVFLSDGRQLDVGNDATITSLDISGDDRAELLIGNSAGSIEAFALTAADTVRSLGICSSDGLPFTCSGNICLSSTFGAEGDLPEIVYSDGNGAMYRLNCVVRGDINNDGTVDVLDLQQLGIHWGQRVSDSGWSGAANLQVNAATSDPQTINVLDLQVLGNFWGVKK